MRIIAATFRDLEAMVARGQFREDLYFRLNVFELRVPPLREREGDVERLALHFLDRYRTPLGGTATSLDRDALALAREAGGGARVAVEISAGLESRLRGRGWGGDCSRAGIMQEGEPFRQRAARDL